MPEPTTRPLGGRVRASSRSKTSPAGALAIGLLAAVFAVFGLVADGTEWALVIAGVLVLVALVAAGARRWRPNEPKTPP